MRLSSTYKKTNRSLDPLLSFPPTWHCKAPNFGQLVFKGKSLKITMDFSIEFDFWSLPPKIGDWMIPEESHARDFTNNHHSLNTSRQAWLQPPARREKKHG